MSKKSGLLQNFYVKLWLTLVFAAVAGSAGFAQNVRLRANANPQAASPFNWKYADITADGNIAVVAGYSTRGAYIFDVSNPDAPTLKAHYNPGDNLQLLEAVVVGNRAYFGVGGTFANTTNSTPNTSDGDGVHIVDISNPANPVLLGKVNATTVSGVYNTIHEIVVDGDYLYENSNRTINRDLKIINISNPAQPRLVRTLTTNNNGWVHAFFVRGGKLYTSGFGGSGLTEIYDIADIETAAPRLLGQVVSGNSSHSSWTSEDGNYLYVCREFQNGDLRVYDIRNLAQPALVKVITAGDLDINGISPHNPVVKGNLLFVAWYQAGTQVFDIANPADPKRVGQYDSFAPAFVRAEAEKEADLLGLAPEDVVCGVEMSSGRALPSTYNGSWTSYPLLGLDRVLVSDMNSGLYVLDATPLLAAPRNTNADFDGDGKTDFSVFARSNGVWSIENSSNNAATATNFGLPTDKIRPGDYDGDGKSDIAVFRQSDGAWYIINSRDNSFRSFYFGSPNDIPVSADFDGDGKTDAAVFRSGVWYVLRSTLGFYAAQWGIQDDEPVVGDFDGDGKADLTVTRNQNGQKIWYILPSTSSIPRYENFGYNTDKTVVADFDGDLRTDLAVYRSSESVWYILNSRTNSLTGAQFGISTDQPIPADYDGDGKADIAVYRSESNTWYGLRTTDSSVFARQFGGANNIPAPAAAQPGN